MAKSEGLKRVVIGRAGMGIRNKTVDFIESMGGRGEEFGDFPEELQRLAEEIGEFLEELHDFAWAETQARRDSRMGLICFDSRAMGEMERFLGLKTGILADVRGAGVSGVAAVSV